MGQVKVTVLHLLDGRQIGAVKEDLKEVKRRLKGEVLEDGWIPFTGPMDQPVHLSPDVASGVGILVEAYFENGPQPSSKIALAQFGGSTPDPFMRG